MGSRGEADSCDREDVNPFMLLGHLGHEVSHRQYSKQVGVSGLVSRVKSDITLCVIVYAREL